MRLQLLLAALLALPASMAAGAPAARAALIDEIEAQYVSTAMFSADSAAVARVLEPAKKANPDVSAETWQSVKAEAAAAMRNVYTEKNGAIDVLMHSSLESLSVEELDRLNHMLRDPAFIKFHEAMSATATQQRLRAEGAVAGVKIGTAINKVLADHHLNEIKREPGN